MIPRPTKSDASNWRDSHPMSRLLLDWLAEQRTYEADMVLACARMGRSIEGANAAGAVDTLDQVLDYLAGEDPQPEPEPAPQDVWEDPALRRVR